MLSGFPAQRKDMARLLIPVPQSVKTHRPLGKGRGVRESRRVTPGALPLGGRNGGRKTGPQRPAISGNTSCPRVRGSLRVVHTASPAVPRPQAPPDCSRLPNTAAHRPSSPVLPAPEVSSVHTERVALLFPPPGEP